METKRREPSIFKQGSFKGSNSLRLKNKIPIKQPSSGVNINLCVASLSLLNQKLSSRGMEVMDAEESVSSLTIHIRIRMPFFLFFISQFHCQSPTSVD